MLGEDDDGESADNGGGVDAVGAVDSGAPAGVGVEGLFGAKEGEGAGGEEVLARVSISTFIPWTQCPGVPQMKYLFPEASRGITVLPSL